MVLWDRPSASCLCILFLAAFCLGAFGYELRGGGGQSTSLLWDRWAAGYSFSSGQFTVAYTSPLNASAAMQQYGAETIDFVILDDIATPDLLRVQGVELVQLPIVGNALALIYNLPQLNGTLVLNGSLLADIYAGQITMWDEYGISELNPDLNLPHANITTVYGSDGTSDDTSAFARALSSFSSNFATSFTSMSALPPAQAGNSYGYQTIQERIQHVASTPYSLAYIPLSFVNASMTQAMMYNRAGRAILPTGLTVQSAMADAQTYPQAGNLTTDLFNGLGDGSWPLSYLSFVAVHPNQTAADCRPATELFALIQWALLNSRNQEDDLDAGYASLIPAYSRRVLNRLNEFTCNRQPLLPSVTAFGNGPPVEVYKAWAQDFAEGDGVVEYFVNTEPKSLANLRNENVDFALLHRDMTAGEEHQARLSADDRIEEVAVIAFPYVPAYNLPQLRSAPPVIFGLEEIADIYLGRIQRWNDSNLSRLNPGVTLPDETIQVLYPQKTDSAVPVEFDALYQLLSRGVAHYRDWLANSSSAYDLLASLNNSVVTSDLPNDLNDIDYSFTVWPAIGLAVSPLASIGNLYRSYNSPPLEASSVDALIYSLLDFASNVSAPNISHLLVLGPNESGWPLVGVGGMAIKAATSDFCESTRVMADFLWWTQSDPVAFNEAQRNGAVVASLLPQVRRRVLRVLANATCKGGPISSLYGCIQDGVLCSNSGSCSPSGCQCRSGYSGTYCENSSSGSSMDAGRILGIVWGSFVGVSILLLASILVIVVVLYIRQRRQDNQHLSPLVPTEEAPPDAALNSIKIEGIDSVEAPTWSG